MRRLVKFLLAALIVFSSLLVFSALTRSNTDSRLSITAVVWSQNSPQGESYEFKIDCQGCQLGHSRLEDCSLYDLDAVRVVCPDGRTHELEKDFNENPYSGEVTHGWVLYGESGEGLPASGEYRFEFIEDNEVILTKTVDYVQSKISYPTNVGWKRRGKDLYVEWVSPEEVSKDMSYKVTVWNREGTPSLTISKVFGWDAESGILENVSLIDGGRYSSNVALYYKDGYAYSDSVLFTWIVARNEVIPADAVKMTLETDVFPPILHSDDWEEPIPLVGPVNTAGAEDAPVITLDGDALFFFFTPDVDVPANEQLLDGVTGIWWTRKSNGEWTEPERIILNDDVALDGPLFVQGNTLWFASVRSGNYREVDVYTAEFRNDRWTNWENAGQQLNEEYDIGELAVCSDGNAMYFGREGESGGRDLWKCEKIGSLWNEPVSLGQIVNSELNEDQPFITPDGSELWFSGQSRLGYTGPAIFRSVRTEDGEWSEPEEIISNFAGDVTLDSRGNICFVHHFFSEDLQMIEADIYVAYSKSGEFLMPADSPQIPLRGFFMGVLPIPADGQSFDEAYKQASQSVEFVPVWGRPTPFYNLAEEISGSWGETFVEKLTRGNGMVPLVHLSFIGPDLTLIAPPEMEEATLSDPMWREAYKDAVLDVVRASRPLYLSVGNEVNRWYEKYGANSSSPNGFQHFVSLYEDIFDTVKELSPETKVFCTFAREIVAELREADLEVLSMFNPDKIDILVFTSYPHAVQGINSPQDIPHEYYRKALDFIPDKPFGFSELGWPSMDAFEGEKGQAHFMIDASGRLTKDQGIDLHLFCWSWLHDIDENDSIGLVKRNGTEKIAYEAWENLSSFEE